MLTKIKKEINKKSVQVWLAWRNNQGGAFIENKALLILSIVVIFGVASMFVFPFIKEWVQANFTAIKDGGTVNGNFGNNVSF